MDRQLGERFRRPSDFSNIFQDSAACSLGLRGEPPTLIVIETKSSAAKLFLEYAILLPKIVNGELLLLIDPSGQGDQYKPEGIELSLRFQNALSQAACGCLRWCVIMKIEFLDVTGPHYSNSKVPARSIRKV